MKTLLRLLLLFLIPGILLFSPPSTAALEPFPPFSIEGNPTRDEYFDLFGLFRFVRAPFFKVFENRDLTRDYVPLMICTYDNADRRDDYCERDNQTGELVDGCDGGEVDLCQRKVANGRGDFARTVTSGNGSCTANKNPLQSGVTVGECEYKKKPRIGSDIKATDFSAENRTLNQAVEAEPGSNPFTGLVVPKIQNEALLYGNMGTDNALTWGTHFLGLTQCEIMTKQLLVVIRAKQTKNTRSETGEWPLGWVDWGYTTQNGKTLLEIRDEILGGMAGAGQVIVEATDDFFLNAGNLDAVSDASSSHKRVCDAITQAESQDPHPEWFTDLKQVPMYSPSFRQGYVHASICVWDRCCPGENCPLPDALLIGNSNELYGDISISQAFGAALDDLILWYPLEEASKILRDLASSNQLIRFAGSAAPNATPSKIKARLIPELMASNPCFKYHFGSYGAWYQIYDYLDTPSFLDAAKQCPGYRLQPEVMKEKAAAFPTGNFLQSLISLIWGAKVDDVEPVVYHLLTVPDAMGQSIAEIKQYVYDTRDTLAELESVKEFNAKLSNVVDDNLDLLKAGKPPYDQRRLLPYYTCADNMFSAQLKTSIEAYALGTRIGCFDTTTVPEGKCDGRLFGELIASSSYQAASSKGEAYFSTFIQPNLSAELMNTYAAAEAETGVPCEILAGIHFVEAANNPGGSLVSGRAIGSPEPDAGGKVFRSLFETAVYAGEHLKGKVGGAIGDAQTAITALSRYNGGGNSNCQAGYPYPIPYAGCPRTFEGEDDPYPTSFLDGKHDAMYLLYCADRTACAPQIFERPGSFAVALSVYNNMTKGGYDNAVLPSPSPAPLLPPNPAGDPGGGSFGFFPETCGTESLSTGLGCIPYTREAFTAALFTFLIGLSGGIALIAMLIGIFQIMTAGGNEEQLKKGKELFTAAVTGLLFLIFSVSLLRIIAGDIIKLPGF